MERGEFMVMRMEVTGSCLVLDEHQVRKGYFRENKAVSRGIRGFLRFLEYNFISPV